MLRVLSVLCFFSVNCCADDWTFEVVQREVVVIDKDYYVVKFSTEYCSPCKSYVTSGKLARLQKKVAVVEVDLDIDSRWRNRIGKLPKVERVPSFWLLKYSDKTTVVKSWEGTVEPEAILLEIENQKKPKVVKQVVRSVIYGRIGTSHESRETLIKHLFNDGIHRGRHSLANLNNMSDIELDSLHNSDHNTRNR
jgi:thiol-disulfide isomerase/thioredoxin